MKHHIIYILLGCLLLLSGCASKETTSKPTTTVSESQIKESKTMILTINKTEVQVAWEDNASVNALKALCAKQPLVIDLEMYGGFEQVGDIGQTLPRNDKQTKTQAGDIVLYAGNQIVIFYGSNNWAYTRLGHITDQNAKEMRQLLSQGDVTITLKVQ